MNNEKHYNFSGGGDSTMLLLSISCLCITFIIIIIILIVLYYTYYIPYTTATAATTAATTATAATTSQSKNNNKKTDIPISKVLTAWPPLTTPISHSGTNNKEVVIFNITTTSVDLINITTTSVEPTPFEIVVSESYLAWGGSGAYALIDNDKTTFWQSNYNVYFPGYNGSAYLGDTKYKGEWFYLKLPKPINLVQYSIGFAGQGPSLWKIYGSNNGNQWIEIEDAEQKTPIDANSFTDNNYTVKLSSPSFLFQYFGCVINSLFQAGGNHAAQVSDCRFYSME